MIQFKSIARHKWRIVLVLFGLLGAGVGFCWWFPNRVLLVDSGSVQADVIVVLGGGVTERPRRAAELFAAHEAPLVICSGAGDCESNQRLLVRLGVPSAALRGENKSANTSENARFTIALLRKLRARKVILVTSWYHSRRALNAFEHYAPEIQFYSRPSHFALGRSEWKSSGIKRFIYEEYAKNLGYWFRYGICPL